MARRSVFSAGPAVGTVRGMIDLGDRFRSIADVLIADLVDVVGPACDQASWRLSG